MANSRFYAFVACLPVAFCFVTVAQTPTPLQTLVQRDRALRAKVTLEDWDDGGAISTFVYQNATEVFSSAPVRRGGVTRDLPIRLRPEIGNFVVDTEGSKEVTMQQFVAQHGVDGFHRRTDQELALTLLSMLPSAHFNDVGVRVVCFRSSIAHPAYTPVYASLSPSRYQRKTRGRVDR